MIIFYLLQEAKQKQRRMSAGALQELFFLPCAPEDPCAVQRGRHVVLPWSSCSSAFRRADSPALFSQVIWFSPIPLVPMTGVFLLLNFCHQFSNLAKLHCQDDKARRSLYAPSPQHQFNISRHNLQLKKSLPKVVWSMNFGCPSDMHNPWVNIRPAPFHGL